MDDIAKKSGKGFVEPFINQVVMLAPKTYALELKDKQKPDLIHHKVICKGFELNVATSKNINFEAYKKLTFGAHSLDQFFHNKRPREHQTFGSVKEVRGEDRLTFTSSIVRNELVPVEGSVKKILKGGYTKGEDHPWDPRFIVPFSEVSELVAPRETFLTKRDKHFE